MRRRGARGLAAVILLFGLGGGAARAETRAVSPGEPGRELEAAGACPTYSWSATAGASAYELAVFRLDGREEPELLFTKRVEGSATSWSPSRAECLAAGGRYGWTVRAAGETPESWAEPLRFRVPKAPDAEELAAALEVIERWRSAQAGSAAGGPAATLPRTPPSTTRSHADVTAGSTAASDVSVATGVAAIRGENPDTSGAAFGALGISHSPAGAGLVARNESVGADLVLDGEANGATDTLLRQDSLDRASANPEAFDFRNSGAGAMALKVDGVDVVTTATDQDTLAALSCSDGEIAKRVSGVWQCAVDASGTYAAGNQLQLNGSTFDVVEGAGSGLDADTVDGLDSTALAAATHSHYGETWSGGGLVGFTVEDTTGTGFVKALVGRIQSDGGAGVVGEVVGGSGSATGVAGFSDSPTGNGVYGESPGLGMAGRATSANGGVGVRGDSLVTNGTAWGVWGVVQSTDGAGVLGLTVGPTGTTRGVWGKSQASPDGIGVVGEANSASGPNHGVWGVSFSDAGTGVRGQAAAVSGATRGVFGESASSSGVGVFGQAGAASGATRGVYGESASGAGGVGVYGKATSSSGLNFGVVGEAPSADSIGVHGLATSTLGNPWGVYGETRSLSTNGLNPRATGVYGLASGSSGDAFGVAGGSASLAGAGVYGFNSGGGYAGYFQGAVHVNGTLSKAAGSFRIDHPLDPAGKYLSHSFVESPDMMNVYNGNVTLDGNGEAWVELPEWFEALNRDFRYQLTPLGDWSALWVAHEIEGNRFLIRGGPHARASWQVTGIRRDAWAEAHRIPVEEAKPEAERGRYLHPELFGEPAEKSLFRPAAGAAGRGEPADLERSVANAPTAGGGAPSPAATDEARGSSDGPR